jgi:hypothetical protein
VAGNIAALDKAGPNGHGTAPYKVSALTLTPTPPSPYG